MEEIYREAPRFDSHAASLILDIYCELNNARPIHMAGLGPIPPDAISSYCRHLDLDQMSIEMVRKIIRQMEVDLREIENMEKDKAKGALTDR